MRRKLSASPAKLIAGNHGQFVSCVAHLTNAWMAAGLITEEQKEAIMECAAASDLP